MNWRSIAVITAVLIVAQAAFADCFTIVVGREASANGYVIMGHNEDDGPPLQVSHRKMPRATYAPGEIYRLSNGGELPQPPQTWAYFWSEMPGFMFSDSFLNEWGVCLASDNCPSREDQPELRDGGIDVDLRRLVAQRARTAREGVAIAGQLVERFGYNASGRNYVISDPDEGWFFCAVNGRHWLAQRVPDDQVAMVSNRYAVRSVNVSDTANILFSPDLIEYAARRGWYNATSGAAFDFAAALGHPGVLADSANFCRQWGGLRHISDQPPDPPQDLPFSVVPREKLDAAGVMTILRDHYEWTSLHRAAPSGSPHGPGVNTICNESTQTSFVAELRGDLPPEIGLLYWVSLGPPCTSAYVPFHFGIVEFPAGWDLGGAPPSPEEYRSRVEAPFRADAAAAYWTAAGFHRAVENQFGRLGAETGQSIREIEADARRVQAAMEASALELYYSDSKTACNLLMNYSRGVWLAALEVMARAANSAK